ncbi:hypothetical protein AAHA92_23739 [Salvia divinorum]|uniref:Uncharacterized protein n=1 Tax=Salvia divinorum TaxID=28513 RepID=A0ABD1GT20_SALDI
MKRVQMRWMIYRDVKCQHHAQVEPAVKLVTGWRIHTRILVKEDSDCRKSRQFTQVSSSVFHLNLQKRSCSRSSHCDGRAKEGLASDLICKVHDLNANLFMVGDLNLLNSSSFVGDFFARFVYVACIVCSCNHAEFIMLHVDMVVGEVCS